MAREATAPTVCPTLRYKDAKAAVAFLEEAFGFTEVAVHAGADGTVQHAELAYGNGVVMLGSERSGTAFSQVAAELGPSSVYVVVADADAHHERAVAAGAEIVLPLTDHDYGSRDYTARDPEGNLWSFGTYAPRLPT
ncbi:VOC family protein [Actinacidiphila sp. bgisy167]|uniref:VOC family protein n=1 Tax=Actinacidiphila sp. bgisy167 TaxID=3413797 RepID=UPI003D757BCE